MIEKKGDCFFKLHYSNIRIQYDFKSLLLISTEELEPATIVKKIMDSYVYWKVRVSKLIVKNVGYIQTYLTNYYNFINFLLKKNNNDIFTKLRI